MKSFNESIIINNIQIPIEKDGMAEYQRAIAEKTGLATEDFSVTKILSKALDLRKQEQFYYKMALVISTGARCPNRQKFSLYAEAGAPENKTTEMQDRPIIVGFGPAGMFAALELIDYGLEPIIFERGKKNRRAVP